jgi:hypothetical protein
LIIFPATGICNAGAQFTILLNCEATAHSGASEGRASAERKIPLASKKKRRRYRRRFFLSD